MKQKTSNSLSQVDHSSIASMRFTDSPCQAVRFIGDGDQMDMIGHQAIREKMYSKPARLFLEQMKVFFPVVVLEKNIHGSNAPLHNMVWISGNDYSFHPCHGTKIA